jgi:FkbH-like protein
MTGNSHGDVATATIRALVADGRFDDAWARVRAALQGGDPAPAVYSLTRNVLRAASAVRWTPPTERRARLAVLCSYEPAELAACLRVACPAFGIDAELYVAPYGQIEQELLSGDGPLTAFAPTHVLLAPSTADLGFPGLGEEPEQLVADAVARWRGLWEVIRREHGARVLQHGFVVPDETALGHMSARAPGSRIAMVREVGRRLGLAAGDDVLLVDVERLAAHIGKRRWIDARLWHAARQPMSAEALALLARDTAAVLAGDLGLGARCLVVDLDNTLWGGVIGEDGLDGIAVGSGPEGEAYSAFQEYLRELHSRGVLLAVASKNDLEAARLPFARHPGMRLGLEDFAAFVADWRRKPEQLAEIAQTLGLGLGSLVFADDNPAECAEVSGAWPEISVVCLDVAPSELVSTLAASPRFETPSLSSDDLRRQRSYAARAQAAKLQARAASLPDFWRSLEMQARVRALTPATLDRAAALTQKTNQFNLTLQRRTRAEIEQLTGHEGAICVTLELADRFADHGLIGLGMLTRSDEDSATATIDTLLLSCRVIGRTAEVHLLSHLSRRALDSGIERLRGVYVPGPRNALVADLYPRVGFAPVDGLEHCWEYDLLASGPLESVYIADRT